MGCASSLVSRTGRNSFCTLREASSRVAMPITESSSHGGASLASSVTAASLIIAHSLTFLGCSKRTGEEIVPAPQLRSAAQNLVAVDRRVQCDGLPKGYCGRLRTAAGRRRAAVQTKKQSESSSE